MTNEQRCSLGSNNRTIFWLQKCHCCNTRHQCNLICESVRFCVYMYRSFCSKCTRTSEQKKKEHTQSRSVSSIDRLPEGQSSWINKNYFTPWFRDVDVIIDFYCCWQYSGAELTKLLRKMCMMYLELIFWKVGWWWYSIQKWPELSLETVYKSLIHLNYIPQAYCSSFREKIKFSLCI